MIFTGGNKFFKLILRYWLRLVANERIFEKGNYFTHFIAVRFDRCEIFLHEERQQKITVTTLSVSFALLNTAILAHKRPS